MLRRRFVGRYLVVSNTIPPDVTSGVALLQRGAEDVTDRGDPADPCTPILMLNITLLSTTWETRCNAAALAFFLSWSFLPHLLACKLFIANIAHRTLLWHREDFCITGHNRECGLVGVVHTMDLRRRDDLVSLGVMLGRPLAL